MQKASSLFQPGHAVERLWGCTRVGFSEVLAPELSADREFLGPPQIGDVVEGTVLSIKPYGAFVDIGSGVSGLLHISQVRAAPRARSENIFNISWPEGICRRPAGLCRSTAIWHSLGGLQQQGRRGGARVQSRRDTAL